jgi:hypothetical protein
MITQTMAKPASTAIATGFQRGGGDAVDERSPHDHVDLVEAVPQNRDADGDG